MRQFLLALASVAFLALSVDTVRAQGFASYVAVNQKVEAADAYGSDSAQDTVAEDFSYWLDYNYPLTWADIQTDLAPYGLGGGPAWEGNLTSEAYDVAGAESHFAIQFTVTDTAKAKLDMWWDADGTNDDGVGNILYELKDLTTNTVLFTYSAACDYVDGSDSVQNMVSNANLVTTHTYQFIAHIDSLTVNGANADVQSWFWFRLTAP